MCEISKLRESVGEISKGPLPAFRSCAAIRTHPWSILPSTARRFCRTVTRPRISLFAIFSMQPPRAIWPRWSIRSFPLSTRPDRRILSYTHNDVEITVTPSVRGRATIFDADILIFCISQLMAALNAGRAVNRVLTLTAHDLLLATGRETSGDSYRRLKDAFERARGSPPTSSPVTLR